MLFGSMMLVKRVGQGSNFVVGNGDIWWLVGRILFSEFKEVRGRDQKF